MKMFKCLSIVLTLFASTLIASDDLLEESFFEAKTTLGGYGELHFNQSSISNADSKKSLDFHRFVMFYSHAWTPEWSFKAELELEHNFVSDGEGELELEQAYINYQRSTQLGVQVGVVLPSVGLLNEYHEPPLFFSVERPDYAKYIVPTTWFGNGVSVYGRNQIIDYKITWMEGLDGTDISHKNGIRSARMKGYKSNADQLLLNARINYVGSPGVKFGVSWSGTKAMGDELKSDIPLNLIEFHGQINKANFISSFEYGQISYAETSLQKSEGYYVDVGYNLASFLGTPADLVPWFRLSDYNTATETLAGGDEEKEHHYTIWKIGLSYRPIPEIALKVDYGVKTNELSGVDETLFNLGAGYMF